MLRDQRNLFHEVPASDEIPTLNLLRCNSPSFLLDASLSAARSPTRLSVSHHVDEEIDHPGSQASGNRNVSTKRSFFRQFRPDTCIGLHPKENSTVDYGGGLIKKFKHSVASFPLVTVSLYEAETTAAFLKLCPRVAHINFSMSALASKFID